MEGGEGVAYHDTNDGPYAVGTDYDYSGTGHKFVMVTSQGEWTKYKFDVSEAGLYTIYLNAAATSTSPRVSIWVDDVLVVNKGKITNTETYSVFVDNKMGYAYLDKGSHTVKVEHTVSNFGFYSLRFARSSDVLVRNDGFSDSIVSAITNGEIQGKKIRVISDVLNRVHNEGYYDAGGEEKFETQADWLISRASDWTSYDVSKLPAGVYNLSVRAGANSIYAKVSVEIDGNRIISKKALANTGGYTKMQDQDFGKITIPEGAKRIRFINDNTHAFYFESFTLK